MTKQEYLNEIINKQGVFFKFLINIRVSSVIVINPESVFRNYKIRELNKRNPLSYLIAFPLIIIALFVQGFNKETIESIKKSFTFH